MSDSNDGKAKPKTSILLIGSLVINAGLAGILFGQVMGGKHSPDSPKHWKEREHSERWRGGAALSESERKELGKVMLKHWRKTKHERRGMREKHHALMEAIQLEPFNREKVSSAFKEYVDLDVSLKNVAADGVFDVMENSSVEARMVLAQAILLRKKPKRGRRGGGPDGELPPHLRRHMGPPPHMQNREED